jgi:hypothetical protein
MNARLLTAVAAAAAVATIAAPAHAAKTIKQTYAVSLPAPFPVMEGMGDFNGCWNGQEGASKNTKTITLPSTGLFKAQVDYTGDWDLYLFDAAKGTMLTASETTETGNTGPATERITFKKAKKGQKVNLVACNWSGLKDATVSYTFTYGK